MFTYGNEMTVSMLHVVVASHVFPEAGDDIDDDGPDFISAINDAPEYERYDETWLIGIIRGAKRPLFASSNHGSNVKGLLD